MNTVSIAILSLAVSVSSLLLSAIVTLYTLVWRGSIRMGRPTHISFGYDEQIDDYVPKVVLRALVYATGKRGHIIETMFLNITHLGRKHCFGVWGLAEGKLDRGGGLFVSETGTVAYHHFLPVENDDFSFTPGEYQIEVCAVSAGRKAASKLFSTTLWLNHTKGLGAEAMYSFDWEPDQERYSGFLKD
jgi:hypothetical protein